MRKRSMIISILAFAALIGGVYAGSQPICPPSEIHIEYTPSPPNPARGNPVFDAYKRFAFKFYEQCLAQDPGENIFVSPLSISICLSMVYNGAAGTTQEAMAGTLELEGLSLDDLNTGTANLMAYLTNANMDSGFELSIANSLWAREGVQFRQDYMDRVASDYFAKLTTLDFADLRTVNTINDWVKEQTIGRIDEVIEAIQPNDILLLVNSVYLKAAWLNQFDKSQTKDREFTLTNGTTKMHPMMRREDSFSYYKGPGFQAVNIPYRYGPLSMYVFLPDRGSDLHSFHASLTPENWDKWMTEFRTMYGELIMPRFEFRYEPDLDAALEALGMEIAFKPGEADFTGMTPDAPGVVWLDRTKHKTYVNVNEEGTEAAAVTSAMMGLLSLPAGYDDPFTMHVDRPFFVAIRDSRTDTILFMGSVVDPEE